MAQINLVRTLLIVIWIIFRSSRWEVFYEKGVLNIFAKFTGKHLCKSLFFNRPATLFNKRLWHRGFPVNFEKFLRAPIFIEDLRWLLLYFRENCVNSNDISSNFVHCIILQSWLINLHVIRILKSILLRSNLDKSSHILFKILVETSLSDFQKMVVTVMKTAFRKLEPNIFAMILSGSLYKRLFSEN